MLVEIKATGICHTDEFTLSGADPEGLFPAILGHEGAGIVREIVLVSPRWRRAIMLYHFTRPNVANVNIVCILKPLCQAIRTTQGQGLMPDGTSRFYKGKQVHHYMGTSTFSNFAMLPEIALK